MKQTRKVDLTEKPAEEITNAYLALCNQMLELSVEGNEEVHVSLIIDSNEVRKSVYK